MTPEELTDLVVGRATAVAAKRRLQGQPLPVAVAITPVTAEVIRLVEAALPLLEARFSKLMKLPPQAYRLGDRLTTLMCVEGPRRLFRIPLGIQIPIPSPHKLSDDELSVLGMIFNAPEGDMLIDLEAYHE